MFDLVLMVVVSFACGWLVRGVVFEREWRAAFTDGVRLGASGLGGREELVLTGDGAAVLAAEKGEERLEPGNTYWGAPSLHAGETLVGVGSVKERGAPMPTAPGPRLELSGSFKSASVGGASIKITGGPIREFVDRFDELMAEKSSPCTHVLVHIRLKKQRLTYRWKRLIAARDALSATMGQRIIMGEKGVRPFDKLQPGEIPGITVPAAEAEAGMGDVRVNAGKTPAPQGG